MKIVITAAGLGSRFKNIGIETPKYLIKAKNKSLLEWSLLSLEDFFNNEFIFIFRNLRSDEEVKSIIQNIVSKSGKKIEKFHIINIDYQTSGQAETVLCAMPYIGNNESVLIYNIDTCVLNGWKNIVKDDINSDFDGLIYTTKADGDHWSFAKVDQNNKVIQVSEKVRISENASIGLYYFKNFNQFLKIYKEKAKEVKENYKETYVMPFYQYLINEGGKIEIKDIPLKDFTPLGTPEEVNKFDSNFKL